MWSFSLASSVSHCPLLCLHGGIAQFVNSIRLEFLDEELTYHCQVGFVSYLKNLLDVSPSHCSGAVGDPESQLELASSTDVLPFRTSWGHHICFSLLSPVCVCAGGHCISCASNRQGCRVLWGYPAPLGQCAELGDPGCYSHLLPKFLTRFACPSFLLASFPRLWVRYSSVLGVLCLRSQFICPHAPLTAFSWLLWLYL